MNWQEEQQAFWDWITRPQDLRDSSEAIQQMFTPHRELSQIEALAIYNNAYHQRLIQISAELYPILYHTLGDEVYTRLWLEYLAQHPPRPGPMSLLGENLHSFASAHARFGKLPAMLDIIELETLLISLFDRRDQPSYTLSQLQALPPEAWPETCWVAREDWALMQSEFDLEAYWAAMQRYLGSGEAVPGEAPFGVDRWPASDAPPAFYLVRRVQHRMQFQRINAAMFSFLTGIQRGESFAQICAALAGKFPDQDIAALSLQLLLKTVDLELLTS